MKRKSIVLIAACVAALIFTAGALTANLLISSKITSRIQSELPKASGISASVPLLDAPQNLLSRSIKSASIKIDNYSLKGSNADSALAIKAENIAKKQPTIIGSLDITATVSAATILENAEFENAQIVGNTLQISVGAGGLGKASLVPRYSNNRIYFQLESVSILGSKIPASSLPADLQSQIKSKSVRTLDVPKGLKVKSVSISSKGLAVNLRGTNIQLTKLGSEF